MAEAETAEARRKRRRVQQIDEEQEPWFERTIKLRAARYWQLYAVELLLRQKDLPPSTDGRHIPLRPSHDAHLVDERRGHGYVSNTIRSSRYTIWDFLPKQFLFQSTRVNNLYFIAVGIPQTIPGLSTTGNYTTILPLAFFICLTVAKEGYDDYRRHRLDKAENNRLATVLRPRDAPLTASKAFSSALKTVVGILRPASSSKDEGLVEQEEGDIDATFKWIRIRWHEIKVGDVVRLQRDEAIPADIALLYASNENGVAYVETMALDGETSLKSRQAPCELLDCHNISGIKSCKAEFVAEDPNRNLYDFNGRLTLEKSGKAIPLTLSQVIYRGTVLRNTKRAVGMVLNTGEECKIRMNANHHPTAKKPRLERQSNRIVLTLVVYVVLVSVGMSLGYNIWHQNYEVKAWYLNDSYVSFRDIIFGFLIMFNNVIPLALYVSLEIVKIGQVIMIHSDREMYDEASDTAMACNTNTILENLGQVSYVLTDKTGTLTDNLMRFRKMSVAGVRWSHAAPDVRMPEQSSSLDHMPDFKVANVVVKEEQASARAERLEEKPSSQPHVPISDAFVSERSRELHNEGSELSTSLLMDHIREHPNSALSQIAREFILGMALCHTALPEVLANGEIQFQATSPDELALVRAAQELGYQLTSRSSQVITLLQSGMECAEKPLVYEVLDVIDFTSKRKRMSIIVRCPDGRIWLLCKGADSAIIPRLKHASLAARKSHEVRQSMQAEREAHRRSDQGETRKSFCARPSLTVRRKYSMEVRPDLTLTGIRLPKSSLEVGVHALSFGISDGRPLGPDCLDSLSSVDEAKVFTRCFKHMDEFATEGLRTLLFAHKVIPQAAYDVWKALYQDATTSFTDREERIEAAGEKIEQGLELLGASAIEDKLQKGVPETIDRLRRANMKIWMLTGDKRETAINIAHSARICKPDSEVYVLDVTKGELEQRMRDLSINISSGSDHSVVVIDGHTLGAIEEEPDLKNLFYELIPLTDSVICCRASPRQKASIVKAIRARIRGALILAIGDGANDIAMIQASHVGVGISGKEGLQAARVADYSIAQFRFLQRLLLVHGRWSYMRTAKFVLYTFFKEFFFYMMQALYQQQNGYTGTSLYENWSLTVLNTLFTSLCVIIPGIYEQDLKAETLLAVPELYAYGQRNMGLNLPDYFKWIALAAAEGILVWYVTWAAYCHFNNTSDNGLFAIGDLCFSLGIAWQNIKLLLLETHYKTSIVAVSFLITFAGWWAWNGFMSAAYSSNLSPYDVQSGFTNTFGNDLNWWMTFLIALMVLIVLELAYKTGKRYLLVAGVWPPWKCVWRREKSRKAEELDVALWQEMEKDPRIRQRLTALANGRPRGNDEDEEVDGAMKSRTDDI